MLSSWLTHQTINIVDSVDNWKQAVRLSAIPLLESDIISPNYIQAIYQMHEKIGPYYVLAPGIAMPHARPEEGVNKLGLSMLLVKNGVSFHSEDNDPVYLITVLAAPDNNSHLQMLTELAELFSASGDMQAIFQADSIEQILSIINKY
ncbi:PTS sugar transporter subunit IIA [Orbus sturtevantii]|uniref:PTS sugar transporter subunit IIA n=1 Tax=Orbus sturtevantii TaxID=3074109 RepID=UPI00370D3412